jgi:hypothetical protein
MKSIIFSLLLFISLSYLGQNPTMYFHSLTVDKGSILKGSNGIFKFPFQNTGNAPLIITSVKSSCGCLAPSWNKNPILPGQWDTTYGKYDTYRIGTINKSMTVQSNDTSQPNIMIKIKGKVIEKPIPNLVIRVDSTILQPNEMNSIRIIKSSTDSLIYSFTLTNISSEPRSIANAHYNSTTTTWDFYLSKEQPLLEEIILQPNETLTLLIMKKVIPPPHDYYTGPFLLIDKQELKFELK